jgi:hypothetical protein
MRWIIAILLALGTPSATAAEWGMTANRSYSCRTFLQYPVTTETGGMLIGWIGGFLSGLNVAAAGHTGDHLLFSDIRPAYGWITDFCRRNPEMKLGTAACAYALDVMRSKTASTGDAAAWERDFAAHCIAA